MSTIPEGGPTENCILLAILPSYKAYLHTQILWTLTHQTQKQAYKRIARTTQIDAKRTYIRTIDPTQHPDAWQNPTGQKYTAYELVRRQFFNTT